MNIENKIYALKAAISTLEKAYEYNKQLRQEMAANYKNATNESEKDIYMSTNVTIGVANQKINDEICKLYCEIVALKRDEV